MDATLTAPAPLPEQAPERSDPLDTLDYAVEDLSPVELVHEMMRAYQQDEDDSRRFYGAADRLIRLLSPRPVKSDAQPDYPLFAVQRIASMRREWALIETAGGFQVLQRRVGAGCDEGWKDSGPPFVARDREEAARLCGEHYKGRGNIQWTATQDGEWAAAGDEASRPREVAV